MTVPTATLTDVVQGAQLYQLGVTSITVNWAPLAPAQGYVLQVSSFSDFSAVASSQTMDLTFTTLTVTGLPPATAYYARSGRLQLEWHCQLELHWRIREALRLGWPLIPGGVRPINSTCIPRPPLGRRSAGCFSSDGIAISPDGNTAYAGEIIRGTYGRSII